MCTGCLSCICLKSCKKIYHGRYIRNRHEKAVILKSWKRDFLTLAVLISTRRVNAFTSVGNVVWFIRLWSVYQTFWKKVPYNGLFFAWKVCFLVSRSDFYALSPNIFLASAYSFAYQTVYFSPAAQNASFNTICSFNI